MNAGEADFWTEETSVLFTSFWGWRPETWATVGWSRQQGRTRRDRLLTQLSAPFIAVIYVTRDPDGMDRDLVGKVAGFYLMSHETGDRDDFTHPVHHNRHPEKWRHSLRALRAFSYISDPLPLARDMEPSLRTGAAQAVASWGKVLTDREQIQRLRDIPWREVPMYRSDVSSDAFDEWQPGQSGMVRAGPTASEPYAVSPSAATMPRRLYVLRLEGDTSAFLGKPADGRHIYKIGVSATPESRRRSFQKAMPRGAFRWQTERSSRNDQAESDYTFDAAVRGENAIKKHLAACSEHLGGEFYLATQSQIDEAWRCGLAAANHDSGSS